jgi:putative hydrolase of the HAD superfamily
MSAKGLPVEGVLFDSGDSLVRDEGRWPGPHFQKLVTEYGLKDVSWDRLPSSLERGVAYLEAHHHVVDEAEELALFHEYYAILLHALGVTQPPRALVKALAEEWGVLDIEPFPETRAVLGRLSARGLRMGIISNAWPSLERKYQALGLRHYFDAFVISAREGCRKPDKRLFQIAIGELGLPPEQIIFVDDDAGYVLEGCALGLKGVLMVRTGEAPTEVLPHVGSLDEVEKFL